MRTLLLLLLLLLSGCILPDSYGVGYIRGGADGTTSMSSGFLSDITDPTLRANSDFDVEAITFFVSWSPTQRKTLRELRELRHALMKANQMTR